MKIFIGVLAFMAVGFGWAHIAGELTFIAGVICSVASDLAQAIYEFKHPEK